MRAWGWIVLIVIALVALLAGAVIGPLVFRGVGAVNAYRGFGPGMPGMMRGFGFMPFGWIGLLLMLFFRVGIFVLIVLGVIWLVSAASRPGRQPAAVPAAPTKPCLNCGRPVQADWRNCPYCGTPLAG